MISKIKTKLSNMSAKDWITLGLWSLTFVILIAFVISAATVSKGDETFVSKTRTFYVAANAAPTAAHDFGIDAKTHASVTATFSQVTDRDPYVLYADQHKLTVVASGAGFTDAKTPNLFKATATVNELKLINVETYATTLAAFASTFGILLVGSMFTTVGFAYAKKRGGNK